VAAEDHSVNAAAIDPGDILALLYEEAKQAIAVWCRDAERTAAQLMASAEARRREADLEAKSIVDEAKKEAERLAAAAAETKPKPRRRSTSQARAAAPELAAGVELLSGSVAQVLADLEKTLAAVSQVTNPDPPGPFDLAPDVGFDLDPKEVLEGYVDALLDSIEGMLTNLDGLRSLVSSDPVGPGNSPRAPMI
jgi:hypothetical protein